MNLTTSSTQFVFRSIIWIRFLDLLFYWCPSKFFENISFFGAFRCLYISQPEYGSFLNSSENRKWIPIRTPKHVLSSLLITSTHLMTYHNFYTGLCVFRRVVSYHVLNYFNKLLIVWWFEWFVSEVTDMYCFVRLKCLSQVLVIIGLCIYILVICDSFFRLRCQQCKLFFIFCMVFRMTYLSFFSRFYLIRTTKRLWLQWSSFKIGRIRKKVSWFFQMF